MSYGLGFLRLSPAAFWAMSLPECEAAMAGLAGLAGLSHGMGQTAPPSRAELHALMRRFPDL